jgi:hypothetical protein
MPTKVIIIAGKKQSGKDTSAAYLIERLTQQDPRPICVQYSFAKPLKDFLTNVMGLDYEQCWGTDAEKNTLTRVKWEDLPFSHHQIIELLLESRDPSKLSDLKVRPWLVQDGMNFLYNNPTYLTGRELMQIFGSNICRRMVPDCWAAATKKKIIKDRPDYAFITDARFPNELDVFMDLNPTVIHLLRDNFQSKHISETALDNYPWDNIKNLITIDNRELDLDNKNSLVFSAFLKQMG